MAAAITLSRTLFQSKKLSILSSRFVTTRNLSGKSEGGSLIEVNLETIDNENEIVGMKRLEDAIYGIIVRRSAPDWLPFSPGSSYWVPPKKRPHGFAELIGKLANPLSEDETLSLTNSRGWPSTTFFIDGSSSTHPLSPHMVEKEIVVETISVDKEIVVETISVDKEIVVETISVDKEIVVETISVDKEIVVETISVDKENKSKNGTEAAQLEDEEC